MKTKNKILICLPVIFLGFFLFANTSKAVVLFEDSFDSQADWTREQPNSGTESYTPPTDWTDAWHESSIFTKSSTLGTKGEPTMSIRNGAGYTYGGTGKAFVYHHEAGEDSFCAPFEWCSDGLTGKSLVGTNWTQGYDEIYIRFRMKLQPGWQWKTSTTGSMKMLHVSHYSGTGSLHDFHSLNENKPRMVAVLQRDVDWQRVRLMTLDSALPPIAPSEYYYDPYNQVYTGEGDPGDTQGCQWGTQNCIQAGVWHTYEFRLKMNSAMDVADGIMQFWVDGVMEGSKTNINWVSENNVGGDANPANYRWNYVWLGGNNYNGYTSRSALSEQWYAIDDFVISTTYVGPDYIIGGGTPPPVDTTPPSAPTGVEVQ
ncbi:MAG: hypothetical protein AAB446_00170 [Patescibacteria group bacterium]